MFVLQICDCLTIGFVKQIEQAIRLSNEKAKYMQAEIACLAYFMARTVWKDVTYLELILIFRLIGVHFLGNFNRKFRFKIGQIDANPVKVWVNYVTKVSWAINFSRRSRLLRIQIT